MAVHRSKGNVKDALDDFSTPDYDIWLVERIRCFDCNGAQCWLCIMTTNDKNASHAFIGAALAYVSVKKMQSNASFGVLCLLSMSQRGQLKIVDACRERSKVCILRARRTIHTLTQVHWEDWWEMTVRFYFCSGDLCARHAVRWGTLQCIRNASSQPRRLCQTQWVKRGWICHWVPHWSTVALRSTTFFEWMTAVARILTNLVHKLVAHCNVLFLHDWVRLFKFIQTGPVPELPANNKPEAWISRTTPRWWNWGDFMDQCSERRKQSNFLQNAP